ncbi:hypothetical protein IMG5_127570 [Ichthyophthirius multifiliis]|uniref:Uncharacterized protein n=1 Tax=Ichthyophthirius multifiliis TaxID=5932 RepID=G0QVY3_ICHMU|nr:hypothetical protein IMG5_127570 [Ichthyophthirius multifiliis]EGR30617.1 hypothetical protein IMG5_127570 [Ichthyophthirius multifiliis]|eukprot:XP_004032204.1 hypothetical protein IMG5_127570 [Ichthyophthirius multifiliis]
MIAGLGIVFNTILFNAPVLVSNPKDQTAVATVLKNVSIIAGLLYLMVSEGCSNEKKKLKKD